ncbi:tRNA A64-2'-O-ribosylphosphate transferase [Trifolium pratense]|uniref:tRNA A64-2'-O-ribosylphosphate transferase n=1 Tax=Trifolium pratense TaxID=57577 RepID=A0A2K3PP61_TRIPR|nr:tRNA A64-2'-O-ribosylphosphate transferase [Trifolium pratense]
MIVDSTRRGKRFPDSMSKTIPIWTCVLNRAIAHYRRDFHIDNAAASALPQKSEDFVSNGCGEIAREDGSCDWDCSLHLPLWVPQTEKASIEEHLEEWTQQLKASGADIASLASSLKKPLRPLWISQKTVIWLNEVPHHDSWDFTPIILVSASSSSNNVSQHNRTTSEFSWNYIPGAGDDEESWSRGLSPPLFWNNVYDLINSGPELCNQKVAEIVEKSRVRRAYKGENAPQIRVKSLSHEEPSLSSDITNVEVDTQASEGFDISWLGSTNLAVGASQFATNAVDVDCILNCDRESISVSLPSAEAYLHLPMVSSKFDRFSLLNNLPKAVSFAKLNLNQGKRLLVCCNNGEDISVCVCLSILMSLFDEQGSCRMSVCMCCRCFMVTASVATPSRNLLIKSSKSSLLFDMALKGVAISSSAPEKPLSPQTVIAEDSSQPFAKQVSSCTSGAEEKIANIREQRGFDEVAVVENEFELYDMVETDNFFEGLDDWIDGFCRNTVRGIGTFDDGNSFNTTNVTKWDMRRRLVFVCKFATNARPSRGNLRQVFNFLIGGKCNLQLQEDDGSDE